MVDNPNSRADALSQDASATTVANPKTETDIIFPGSAITGNTNTSNGGPMESTEDTLFIWPKKSSAKNTVNPGTEADIFFPRSAVAGNAKHSNVSDVGEVPSMDRTSYIWPKKSSAINNISPGTRTKATLPKFIISEPDTDSGVHHLSRTKSESNIADKTSGQNDSNNTNEAAEIISWEHLPEGQDSIINTDSKLIITKGDYFYPYDRDLAAQAKLAAEIGWGGSGTVRQMRAHDHRRSQPDASRSLLFARKIIRKLGRQEQDIENEIRVIKKLCSSDREHNLVQIFYHESRPDDSTSSLNDIYLIDMELCIKNLRNEINANTSSLLKLLMQIPVESTPNYELKCQLAATLTEIVQILSDVLRGLEFIHLNNEVHRDLKPENVLYSYIHRRWKIADFGTVSKGMTKSLLHTTSARGTEHYRGPELLSEQAGYSKKTDMWAFGCIAYEICTKEKPFPNDWATMEYKNSGGKPPKTIFQFSPEWQLDKRINIISDDCVTKTLQLSWESRPSATELLKLLKSTD